MVPKVVGSNPIFHPKFESLAVARLFFVIWPRELVLKRLYNKKIVSQTHSNFGNAPAASGGDGRDIASLLA